jgi:hypothetical protein
MSANCFRRPFVRSSAAANLPFSRLACDHFATHSVPMKIVCVNQSVNGRAATMRSNSAAPRFVAPAPIRPRIFVLELPSCSMSLRRPFEVNRPIARSAMSPSTLPVRREMRSITGSPRTPLSSARSSPGKRSCPPPP